MSAYWGNCCADSITFFVNHMPEPAGTFPDEFRTRDPYYYVTDYFDETFPWVKDDFGEGENFYFDMTPFCTDQDVGGAGNDKLWYSIT